jgi:hypothetical protein
MTTPLARLGLDIFPYGVDDELGSEAQMLAEVRTTGIGRFIVRTEPTIPLRAALEVFAVTDEHPHGFARRARFVLGATYVGDGLHGHYTLSDIPASCVFAVYQLTPSIDADLAFLDGIAPRTSKTVSPPVVDPFLPLTAEGAQSNEPPQRREGEEVKLGDRSFIHNNGQWVSQPAVRTNFAPASAPTTIEPNTASGHITPWVEVSDEMLEAFLRGLAAGDRICVPWRDREGVTDYDANVCVWTGTVESAWDQESRSIVVYWDSGLPRLVRSRRGVCPAADLPDPAIVYGHPYKIEGEPSNGKKKPKVMTHGRIRAMLRDAKHGDVFEARWAHGLEATTSIGRLVDRTAGSKSARLEVALELCPYCGSWRAVEDFVVELPEPNAVYFALEKRTQDLPDACCDCDAEGDVISDGNGASDSESDDHTRVEDDGLDPYEEERVSIIPAVVDDRASGALKGKVARRWFIHHQRPPHVHSLAWRQLATATRTQHRRWLETLRAMPNELADMPFGTAAIEVVNRLARARKWKWSTYSTALSALASACKSLPLYTNALQGIDLRTDAAYVAAMRRAQHLARVTSTRDYGSLALPADVFKKLCQNIKLPNVKLLLQLCWRFAARVGDMRQVHAADIDVQAEKKSPGRCSATITFRYGKGAAFWGPYTVHALLDADVAKAIQGLRAANPSGSLFTVGEQATLSSVIKEAGFNLRSIRRGSLVWLASLGVADENLRLLSGHKRVDTLLRYLGWGKYSAAAHAAALAREHATVTGAGTRGVTGGCDAGPDTPDFLVEPPKMGPLSGRCGLKGRRIAALAHFIPKKAPSKRDLGTEVAHDTSEYTIHMKPDLPVVQWERLHKIARGTPWAAEIARGQKWCETPVFYGTEKHRRIYHGHEIPYARLTSAQAEALCAGGKLQPHEGPIHGYAKGFLLAQHGKRRWRPIFEPAMNDTVARDDLSRQRYPSRWERRASARKKKFALEFDFSAYFDQFLLHSDVRKYFVVKVKGADGPVFYDLTRMPMGARFAPGVAQAVTWAIIHPLLKLPGVAVDTMIDNVRIACDDARTFLQAVSLFKLRVAEAGVTLNETFDGLSDSELLAKATSDYRFLGEEYLRQCDESGKTTSSGYVRNTVDNLEKVGQALERFSHCAALGNKCPDPITTRHAAALIGLCLWMAHTLAIDLCRHAALIRSYSLLVRRGMAKGNGWDEPLEYIAPSLLRNISDITTKLMTNDPVPLPVLVEPGKTSGDYDLVAMIDASKTGWAAYLHNTKGGTVHSVRQNWTEGLQYSAHAEPKAVSRLLEWLHRNLRLFGLPASASDNSQVRLAIVTDHDAIVNGQRRWYSRNGGFSSAYELNQCYVDAYREEGWRVEFFAVQGTANIADALSRDTSRPTYTIVLEEADVVFPALSCFRHPYLANDREARYV